MKVAAIVLNWNRLDDTLACVESLAAVDYEPLDIIVVDNGSEVSPRGALERAHPGVVVVENRLNLGYCGGNNVGLRRGLELGAECLWVLNNDAAAEPGSLAPLVETLASDDAIAAVGSKVVRADRPERLWVAWGRVTWLQSLIALEGADRSDDGCWDGRRQVEWLPGCSILFRAEALRDVGFFDEEFFAYHEDVDWAARATRRGWRLYYDGRSKVLHAVHGSSGGSDAYVSFRKYLSARNSVLYARRHGRWWQQATMAAAVVSTLPFQLLKRALRGEQEGIYLKLRGWRDGLLGRPLPLKKLGLR